MYVIVGSSAAAVGCIEGIRQVDKTGPITVVTEETQWNYARPLISYLLEQKTDDSHLYYKPDSFYAEHRVTVKAGVAAVGLDAAGKTLQLSDGSTLPYQKLLLATGSSPFVPPVPGLDGVKPRFTFQTLASARALAAGLGPKSRVLILGAGLTGVKCAEGIRHRCGAVAIVDLAPRVLPAVLDEAAAALVQAHMEQNGVQFYLSDSVARFDGHTARLQSGAELAFDVLVVAVGVRPNTQLARQAGAAVEQGIVVDDACRTTVSDVWAAGDCTQGFDAVSGQSRMLPLWPNAVMQGETAGVNMAGGTAAHRQGIALNASGVFGLHMITAGSCEGESYVVQHADSYKRLITREGRLVGAILVGDVARGGIYTNLIRQRTPLEEIDFERIKESPQLMAFSKQERRRQLGGEV